MNGKDIRQYDTVILEFAINRRRLDQSLQDDKWAWVQWSAYCQTVAVIVIHQPSRDDDDQLQAGSGEPVIL